jgi:hypothetical protein
MRGWTIRRDIGNQSATERVIGRSSTKPAVDLMKIPTDTGSTCIGPSVSR